MQNKSFNERVLLMGPPGSGKTTQIINVARFVSDFNIKIYMIDLENKLYATLSSMGNIPKNLKIYEALSWEELETVKDLIVSECKPGEWIMTDRTDLIWSFVQRWYTQKRYNESLADLMTKTAVSIKKSMMVAPRFDMGSWQVINENYEDIVGSLFYRTRANVIWTTGIQTDEDIDVFNIKIGNKFVKPRGQKEIAHQPNSVFYLEKKKETENRITTDKYYITTAKDLPNRTVFSEEELSDFAYQYLAMYYQPK